MKIIFAIAFCLIALLSNGQNNEKVKLNWKIGKQDTISYLTIMNDIDTSAIIKADFDKLFKSLPEFPSSKIGDVKDFFSKLNQSFKNIDFITILTSQGDGIVDIIVKARPKDNSPNDNISPANRIESDLLKNIQSMTKGILLRGSVYETGGIQSFWVNNSQRNLISLLFELPSKPVQIGDTWQLDINLIAIDQNFICDSSYKENKVTMIDLKKVNGDNIATIKFNITEFVKGKYYSSKTSGFAAAMTKITLQAIAEFSIAKGRWISYDGIMALESTGAIKANKKTKFTLKEE
jgi:hypothetical protein